MIRLILRRLAIMIPQLFLVSVLVFTIAKFMPGDALTGLIEYNPRIDAEQLAKLRAKYGLDDPMYVQYFRWAGDALHGDLGQSIKYKIPVIDVIGDRLWNTAVLGFWTFFVTYAFALPMGLIAGRFAGGIRDRIIVIYNYIGFATPTYVSSLLLLLIFAFIFDLFPSSGSVDIFIDVGTWDYYVSRAQHLVLPVAAGALISTTIVSQYLRSEIIDQRVEGYVTTARAKGLSDNRIYYHHIFRNALLPIAAFVGYNITAILGGSIFVESIFSYPGIGKLFLASIVARDYSLVVGLMLFSALLSLFGTLISDIILGLVDPRIRIK